MGYRISELEKENKELKQSLERKNPRETIVMRKKCPECNTVNTFKDVKEIDGFLIGGASKSSKKFIDIIKNYYR